MNAEQNPTESHIAAPPPPPSQDVTTAGDDNGAGGAPGSSSKSRRRRRKRKNRAAAGAAPGATAEGGVIEGGFQASGEESAAAAAPQTGNQQRSNSQANGQQGNAGGQNFSNNGGQGQGAKRWKKKKFGRGGEGGGQPRPEPGNSLQGSNSGGTGRGRNRKQGGSRGPRAFVGPMDHSYREANGNFADVPASTIHTGGPYRRSNNNHRNHGNEDRMPAELMHNIRPAAIAEDAPTHIYFFIEDLFFTAKIQETARLQGVKVAFIKPDKDIVEHLAELPEHEHPSLIVFDLNNASAKPLTLIPKLKTKLKKGTSIIGFLSHLQGDLKAKAVEAGCHSVMPRAAFSQNLPNLLRRYNVEEEHEPNFNQ